MWFDTLDLLRDSSVEDLEGTEGYNSWLHNNEEPEEREGAGTHRYGEELPQSSQSL